MPPSQREIVRAKYTVKVPSGVLISPLSFDQEKNIYFSTDEAFYRVSAGSVEQIAGGVPSGRYTPGWFNNQLVSFPPLALSESGMFLPGEWKDGRMTLTLVDPENGPLWECCPFGYIKGVVSCRRGGCFCLSEEGRQQSAVEKIDHLGNKEWAKTYIKQPFHTFGPPNGGDKLLFLHGDGWAPEKILRLMQLDSDGNEICIDEFIGHTSLNHLWAENGSLLLMLIQRDENDCTVVSYEIRRYAKNALGDYHMEGKWVFHDPESGLYVGYWGVSPSGNYLCYTCGDVTSQGCWSNRVLLFFLEGEGSMRSVFLNRDTPLNISLVPGGAAPIVTDTGVVLSSWDTRKSHPFLLTDFSEPGIPTRQVRNSSKTTLSLEYHDSTLYLVEYAAGWAYLSVFPQTAVKI